MLAPIWCPSHETVHVACHHSFAGLLLVMETYIEWFNLEMQMFRSVEATAQGG